MAVDLLLDNAVAGAGAGSGNGGTGHTVSAFAPVSGAVRERVPALQKLLQALEMLPAEEPPADLVARTMRRVEADAGQRPDALRPPQGMVGGMQVPHA